MRIESQVCSLELAIRLKELGVKQDSLVDWLNIPDIYHYKLNEDGTLFRNKEGQTVIDRIAYNIRLGNSFAFDIDKDNCWSAFTVAELGEMLQWEKLYIFNVPEKLLKYVDGRNTEADARAKMLIYLLENKLMELPNE